MTSAHADDVAPYQPVNLPACEVITLPGGARVCGFRDIEDWKAVLRVDAEISALRTQVAAQAVELAAVRERAAAFEAALSVREHGIDRCQRSLDAERAALIERDKLYQRERARPRWGTRLSWGVAAVAGGVALGLALR